MQTALWRGGLSSMGSISSSTPRSAMADICAWKLCRKKRNIQSGNTSQCPIEDGQLRVACCGLYLACGRFSRSEAVAFSADSTRHMVTWSSSDNVSIWSGLPVRFRFILRACRLFSFWVSHDRSGRELLRCQSSCAPGFSCTVYARLAKMCLLLWNSLCNQRRLSRHR